MKPLNFAVALLVSIMLSSYTPSRPLPVVFNRFILTNFTETEKENNETSLFAQWNLKASGISKNAFEYAKKGFDRLVKSGKILKSDILAIVDFSKPSHQKRLFVIHMKIGKVLTNSLVAHGRNSGELYASDFSNTPESYKSSLGFYVTKQTYMGANGYSLKLAGLEKGFNDNAETRAIVMHGAGYVSQQNIDNAGYLGRSFGCPAIPEEVSQKIIDQLKGGSCLFIYSPVKKYLTTSKILNS